MALVRWEPFRELASLSEMSRLMSGLLEGQSSRAPQSWIPPLDVWETEQEVVYAFDLPGIPKDTISLEVHVPKPEEQKPTRIALGGNGVKADIEASTSTN